ncbi:MAG: arylsulfatase [Minicystis sp.]
MNRLASRLVVTSAALCALVGSGRAQEVLPRPAPGFHGRIGLTYRDSTPDKLPVVKAPAGAPNVLVILIDDAGFGQTGTFGGQIPTPTLDRLAENGLRYTRYHTTALCSPTRAAILTGRNHHSVASGNITELATGYPGYTSVMPRSAAPLAEILRQNGYSTAAFGKWHNTPDWETSVAGPFDRWPTSQGFDRFFGFLGGEANQWAPALYDQTTPVEMRVPRGREGEYTLNVALADQAIAWMRQQKSVTPDRPFFVYYAPGATHAPHHVPRSWIDRFRGRFDQGWDRYREETFARQKKLGVVPEDAQLTPRPTQLPAWDALTPDQKRLASRLMETFAAYTAQTDHEIGRVIDAVAGMGQLDDTLVLYEVGDNGASGEGGLYGAFNEMVALNGLAEDPAYAMRHLDEIGGPKAYNHYPAGWAWAMNTPFQWVKQIASHLGGSRNPLVVSWPARIADKGAVRTQFFHCIDVVPTILEAAGIPAPAIVDGVTQQPIEGASMLPSFADAKVESPRKTQYFEMLGNRAIYHEGWIAAARHGRLPWQLAGSFRFEDDRWELYDLDADFSQAVDLAAREPQKLREMQYLFWAEAGKHDVLPLDDRFSERVDPAGRPSLVEGRTRFVYFPGAARIPEGSSPDVKNRSHTITAVIDIPRGGAADGVLVAAGGVAGGYSLYVKDRRLTYQYNDFSLDRFTITATERLPAGRSTVRFEFAYDGGGAGKGGTGALFVDGKKVGEGRIEKTIPHRFSADETFDTGADFGSPASDAYASPFRFRGLDRVEIDLAPR